MPSVFVPEISLGDSEERIVSAIHEALTTSGFFQLSGHGIAPEVIANAFETSKKLFDLSLEEKRALIRNPHTNRGWEILGGQSLEGAIASGHEDQNRVPLNSRAAEGSKAAAQDLKEGWMVGPPKWQPGKFAGRFGHGYNVFPTEQQVPEMEKAMGDYYVEVLEVMRKLMRLVALSLKDKFKFDPSYFEDASDDPVCAIRLLHYPPSDPAEVAVGAGAHTDFGFLTVLAPGSPGLELWDGNAWAPVEPREGALIINSGDLLSMVTGGYYLSSLHRVINRSPRGRYSIAMFMDGNSDSVVSDWSGRTQSAPTTVERHLRSRFDVTYQATESTAAAS